MVDPQRPPAPSSARRAQEQEQPDPGARLMLAWQAGDERAFEEIVRRYSGRVYALFTRFLGPYESREDLVQEVFLRLVRARASYVASARFTTFLYRIAFNLCVNERERAAARREVGLADDAGDSGAELADVEPADEREPGPGAGLERQDVVAAVRGAIAGLPETQRMALILARYDELPYDEIGRVLGIGAKAVKSLVHRARESLRAKLAPYLHEEPA
jgi:RNA polymerase sigma-70 factor (ECF subfamily)